MLGKLFRDFRANRHILINHDNNSKQLSHYYILFDQNPSKLNRLIHSFDSEGIPLNSSYIDVAKKKLHYYPISIGQFGLSVFHSWLETGIEEKKAYFLRIAEWFIKHKHEDEQLGIYWLTEVDKPEYHVISPWKSAFTQSRAISILLRAWQLTNDEKYLSAASKALIPFTKDITEGGVSVDRASGTVFYEEYVAVYPTRVLDGHNFSLFGLYDYIRAVDDEHYIQYKELALQLFQEGINGLVKQLPKFDMGFWLHFNRCDIPGYPQNDPCTMGYLRLVSSQLEILNQLSHRQELLEYAHKCKQYDSLFNIIKMYRLKFHALRELKRL